MAHQPGTGAVREGCALLQGLATCGTCGRKLAVYYEGEHKATPGYYCTGTGQLVEGRGTRHLRVGGVAIDAAVTAAFLAALEPVALQACLEAARQLEQGHDTCCSSNGAARSSRPATTPPGPNAATRPSTRTTGWSPAAWKPPGRKPSPSWPPPRPSSPAARQPAPPRSPAAERAAILALGDDLQAVWDAPSTTDKDRKQLLRTLLDEVEHHHLPRSRRRPR